MKEETILLCAECLTGEVVQHFSGDEGWGICSECNATEQEYYELTYEEMEAFECMDLEKKDRELKTLAEEIITNLQNL